MPVVAAIAGTWAVARRILTTRSSTNRLLCMGFSLGPGAILSRFNSPKKTRYVTVDSGHHRFP